MSLSARNHIAEVGHSFIQDGHTVLIHGLSRVATALILKAAEMNTYFNLVITEGRPNLVNQADLAVFEEAGIPTRIIPDSGVGVMMEEIDFILVGAEGVMENGGIINKVRESIDNSYCFPSFLIIYCFNLFFLFFCSFLSF
jgi:translation initiation factor eIF-2B subunit alpha